jgi:hypothetical protein
MLVIDNKAFEDPEYMVMADDGNGESVYIPSFLITMHDGIKIKEEIHKTEDILSSNSTSAAGALDSGSRRHHGYRNKVIIKAQIDLAKQTRGNIEVDLWYSGAYELLNAGIDFNKYAEMTEMFSDQVTFHPRIMTTSCQTCSVTAKKACVADGNYCPVIPYNLKATNVFG